jgi:hypothetical protein
VYDPPMTFTILRGSWVGNTGCPAKSSTKGGHPSLHGVTTWKLGFLDLQETDNVVMEILFHK